MIHVNMITRFTENCVRHDIISSRDAEWFSYGLIHRCGDLLVILFLFPLGCWLSSFTTSLSFYVSFFLLRKRTNGYHAKTFIGCFLFSLCSECMLFLLLFPYLSNIIILLILVISIIVIFLLAPYNHPNLHMTGEELSISGHMARQTALILILVAILAWKFDFHQLVHGITLGIGFTAFLLVVAYTIKWKSTKGEMMNNGKQKNEISCKNTRTKNDPARNEEMAP